MSLRSQLDQAIHATRTRRMLVTAIGVTALSLIAGNVSAQTAAPQMVVSLADINLATPSGAEQAYVRLQRAARSVCRGYEARNLHGRERHAKCYANALSDAVADIDSVNVTALLNSDRSVVRVAQREQRARSAT